MASSPSREGGFLQSDFPTPPTSSIQSSVTPSVLPHSREHPLKPGSKKEATLVRYLDQNILHIKRRFAKRLDNDVPVNTESIGGYQSFQAAGEDIECLIDVLWVSATPNIQIPYLLSLALLALTCLSDLPLAAKTMFRVLEKLDKAFASLIQGRDLETGELLPGFENGRKLSDTEKVRIKSIIERTRIRVVEVMAQEESHLEVDETESDPDDFNMDSDQGDPDEPTQETGWEREVATVYDRTLVELGDILGEPPIGIIQDDSMMKLD